MTSERTTITRASRTCDRCGKSHAIEVPQQAEAAGFIGWVQVSSEAVMTEAAARNSLKPYDLCPRCALAFVEWWRGMAPGALERAARETRVTN